MESANLITPVHFDLIIRALADNKVVIMPCDTIYGFVGTAPETYSRIAALKKRTEKHFLQLIPDADISPYSPDVLPAKVRRFWPAPLTVIVRDYNGGTVALRYPNDPFLQKVLTVLGRSLYSTSVNISGESPLNSVEDIVGAFGHSVALIVDGGNLEKKAPSTIVDLTRKTPVIVREGAVSSETVRSLFD